MKSNFVLKTIQYNIYKKYIPQEGNWIIGQKVEVGNEKCLVVYQAFNKNIVDYAVANQEFGGPHYSKSRMTWLFLLIFLFLRKKERANFLWMMYRCGWCTKDNNQKQVVAIVLTQKGFNELLNQGVYSSYHAHYYETHEDWKQALTQSGVRIQWDPDHTPKGGKCARRQ